MVVDYRERKLVPKNKPKKQPVKLFGFLIFLAVLFSFAAGIFTGWLVFRPGDTPTSPMTAPQAKALTAAPETGQPPVQAPAGKDVPLTFYETLPKGNSNALIGSGINPARPEEPASKPGVPPPVVASHRPKDGTSATNPPAAPTPNPASTALTASTVTPGSSTDKAPSKKDASKGVTYVVQVASFRDRKEAEAAVTRLVEKGFAAYISESKVPEKGIWYRVRIGKFLDQKAAADLASRAGKGAVPIAE